MDLLNPWGHIAISSLRKNEQYQFYDNKIRIVYSLRGSVCIRHDDHEIVLGSNDFFIITKAQRYDISQTVGKVFCFTIDYVRNSLSPTESLFKGDSITKVRSADFEVTQSLKHLLLLKSQADTVSINQLYREYFTLLTILEKYYAFSVTLSKNAQGRNRIEEIKNYIDVNFEKELTLTNLAQRIFVSEQYLSKIFKEEIGIGVSEYIIKRRLEKVRRYLTETELPITDIAFESGFSNINSFNRLFKKYQGVTPSVYRNETKQNVIINSSPKEVVEEDFTDVQQYLSDGFSTSQQKKILVSTEGSRKLDTDKLLINLGFAEDLLHRSYIKSVKPISQYARFKYGRIWGIIDQSILKDVDGEFDFTKIDDILQAILDLGLKPFLDLGLKGKTVHGANRQILSHTALKLPTQEMEDLLRRYEALIDHCIEKFGVEEVSSWRVEFWKPEKSVLDFLKSEQLTTFNYKGKNIDLATNQGYLTYFEQCYKRIKTLLPNIKIGGCGLNVSVETEILETFLQEWSQREIHPDFLSLSIFPIDMTKDIMKLPRMRISADTDYTLQSVFSVKRLLEKLNFATLLYVTEFNVTINSRDIINDTCFKGPYILKNTLPVLDEIDLLGYWQLSDFSSSATDVAKQEFFGGSGLITKNGIPKPAFFAFDFLGHLGDVVLHQSDGLMITKSSTKLFILSYHYSHLNGRYYYEDNHVFDRYNALEMFEADGKSQIEITLKGLLEGRQYQIKQRKMGINDGALIYQANNFSSSIRYREDEINYIRYRCIPTLSRDIQETIGDSLTVSLELNPHDMIFMEITLD
ncbi:GH39 family glycosyl hydrolase [Streptococcus sp. S784/96/1]|uniref:GH39 family glycosyl hydrolase n=1 Tax=Streptococcus sp. S784/96/1 TaxID=2653499 RepID=UPI00138A5616|nr:helix-turn-helix domain-containing protein [Streptococcus sp. S784/96/1]